MAKCKYPLDADETELGTWTTNIILTDIGRFVGDLTITNKKLIYLSKFDMSLKAIANKALFYGIDQEQYLVLPRERIKNVKAKKSLINKRVIITLDDGDEIIIDNGMLSVDKIMKALEK
ncbi:hypothetical protein [Candidatus Contubernalis alkaliaceticus]|uniref:hypothetical protein n=1 Tax=Candidatus Contubernalis alkaliaceticus TaxID=338645 RepID=UPI001F4C48C6|nr:hypothetical protein [Candidatus Contubernalis alkalaceticus]UNC91453.1 hypothetical protein HUE98_04735 [Candidatus Contubernalis alkalaceticus]